MNQDPISSPESKSDQTVLRLLSTVLAIVSFCIVLAYHNIADGDMWARLVAGASVYHTGQVITSDFLAYTPVLPEWIDHEWGAGLAFYALLVSCGPMALMALKIFTAFAALCIPLASSWTKHRSFASVLFAALPCALAILPGFVPVVRSHVFTYAFFAATLVALEELRAGRKWPIFSIPAIMLVWANMHGGFVAGLGIIALYTAQSTISGKHRQSFLITSALSLAVTFVNPYGLQFWSYLLPAILHKRSHITEWSAMPLLGFDTFIGFRILLPVALITIIQGWKKTERKRDWIPLIIMFITALLGIRHRRHAPFFGIASALFLPSYVKTAGARLVASIPHCQRIRIRPEIPLLIIFGLSSLLASAFLLPRASFQVLAPLGFYPVRECDILERSGSTGKLIVPFRWGSYAAWRLHPNVLTSVDGRYEETFPESTFLKSRNFMRKTGPDWDRILKEHGADFVITEKGYTALTVEDLERKGFILVWDGPTSRLFAKNDRASRLIPTIDSLPDNTVDPLDVRFAAAWKDKLPRE